jgi:hypothetical protein
VEEDSVLYARSVFLPTTNAQGWKVHLKNQHEVLNDVPSALQADEEATSTS